MPNQKRLKSSFEKKEEARTKAFCCLMMQGKVSKAHNYIENGNNASGVLSIDDSNPADPVLLRLKDKHPIAQPVDPNFVTKSSGEVVEPVIFEDITNC